MKTKETQTQRCTQRGEVVKGYDVGPPTPTPLSQAKFKKCKYKNEIKPKIVCPLEILLRKHGPPLGVLGKILTSPLDFQLWSTWYTRSLKTFL
jgi:hypothetical protein